MRFPGFIGPSYTLQSVNYDAQRCINLFPQINEIGSGKSGEVACFVTTPGLDLRVNLGDGPIRGQYVATNKKLYVVSGNKVFSIDSSFNETEIGTINTTLNPVSMADNGDSLVLVDGVEGYVVDLTNDGFSQITDPDFKAADKVVYQDGYFVFNEKNSGRFFISGFNSTDLDALEFEEAVGNPDDIVSIISDHRDLWLLGTDSIEVFYNSGNTDFPFERIDGAFVEHGCAAPFSVEKMNNEVYWLGRDDKGNGIVYKASGYQPQRISTHAVELAIGKYENIEDAASYTYQQSGHHFYVINFKGAKTSWCYDTSTGLWHERAYTNQGQFERHRADNHAFFNGEHIVGDYQNGNLYAYSEDVFSDNGDEITRQRVAPHITSSLNRVLYHSFQLDMEVGVGLDGAITNQGHDPQAMLQWSDDGGHTWSKERWKSFGKIGRRKKRAIWRKLGYSRDRIFRVSITDPVKIAIIGAQIIKKELAS